MNEKRVAAQDVLRWKGELKEELEQLSGHFSREELLS